MIHVSAPVLIEVREGGMRMKRDLAVVSLGLCLIILGSLAAGRRIVSAMGAGTATSPTLVLDAGHGGEDGGAVSASGHKESDINLAIVLKLRDLMAFLGTDAVLTRDADVSVYDPGCKTLREKKVSDLKNRVAMVRNLDYAMVISVHQNTFTDSRYKGAQVFFVAGELSRQWGDSTQAILNSTLGSSSRKAALIPDSVYLFSHIDCPAILVECGFLSNGEEASLLLTDSYQRKLAAALAAAYFHQLQMMPGGDYLG